jgi:hypothetical protein
MPPYWSEEITRMFASYKVRNEEAVRKNDGTTDDGDGDLDELHFLCA